MNQLQIFLAKLGGLSYLGIFGVSLVANILFIIPEEVVLLSLGYITRAGKIDIFIVIPIVILGLLVSDYILYTLSRSGNRIISLFYDKFFSQKLALFNSDNKEVHWYEKHIEKVIFYSRFLIQLRFLGPFMAGRLNVRPRTFLTYELAALIIYVPLFMWTGWYFRSQVEYLITGIEHVKNIIMIGVGILIALSLIQYFRKKFLRLP